MFKRGTEIKSLYAVKQRKGTRDFELVPNNGTPTQSTAGTNTWVRSCYVSCD